MIDNIFRQQLPKYIKPITRFFINLNIHPNHLTIIGLFLATLASISIAISIPSLGIILWISSRLFDGFDGIVARHTKQTSPFGAYLDICTDMLSYSLMNFAFSIYYPHLFTSWLSIQILYTLCITTALALGSIEKEYKATTDNRGLSLAAGLAEGGETSIAYVAFIVLPQYINLLSNIWISVLIVTISSRTIIAFRVKDKPSSAI
jgi:phosphatidylglycerophosphate synthase